MRPNPHFHTRLGASRPISDSEIQETRFWIEWLEAAGYIVRKPSEADLESVLEVEAPTIDWMRGQIGIRLDTSFNGVPYACVERFPVDLVLSKDDRFRKQQLPQIFARKLGDYIAQRFMDGIAAQVVAKIEPFVPEEPMSLDEIITHIAGALETTKHRIDPRRHDEHDNSKKPPWESENAS